jgi:SAM-dependent methyltransferase
MKAFSRALLHDKLISAPFMHRCLTKPQGYPGDFIVMQYLYTRHFEGSTLLAKAIHLATVFTRGARAVRARKDLLYDTIVDLATARAAIGERTRVISIAAGPAKEIFDIFENAPELVPTLDILLFDQDEDALELVNNGLALMKARSGGGSINIQLRHDAIRRLLDDETIFDSFGPADLIFSAGLFDYLRFHTGVRLVRNLYRNLSPGGRLYVGNMVPENPCRWFLEHHLDWFLEYRTREELRAMGEAAVSGADIEIIEEETGVNPFLLVRRT